MGRRPDEAVLAEYETLTAEIAQINNQLMHIFTFTMTAAVAVIAFGLERTDWRILSLVPLILVPSGLLMLARVEAQMQVASYLRLAIEERYAGFNWETVLIKVRANNSIADTLGKWAFYLAYVGIGLVALALSWFYGWRGTVAVWVLGVMSLFAIAVICISISLVVKKKRNTMADDCDTCLREFVTQVVGDSDTGTR